MLDKDAKFSWILPILLGVCGFFMVTGSRVLITSNLAWLVDGDFATHYLGWAFFRNSGWSFPIGLNPGYGLEISNAILFSDSNPLLAFLFKPFSMFLPQTFQYFGLWMLLCFILQAWFGWKLVGLLSPDRWIRLLGAGFFVFAPPMLWRLQGHPSLAGHFLITAALYLALHPSLKKRKTAWCLLLVVSALIHSYLLAMVGLIWLADLTGKTVKREFPFMKALSEFGIIFSSVSLACWQTGYFSVGAGVVSGGFGFYRMNLLSMADPSGWSYVLKDLPEAKGDFEGFNFLGLGIFFLIICSFPTLFRGSTGLVRAIRRYPVLLALLVVLILFAVSNKVGFGAFEWEYPLPQVLLGPANVFRASGRMFWPVFYLIIFTVIFLTIRGKSHRTAQLLLGLALVIQIADTSAFWRVMRANLMKEPQSAWPSPLVNAFWDVAASRYGKIRLIHPQNHSPQWQPLADYAGKHGLATDAVFLARVGTLAMEQAQRQALETIVTGRYKADTLYVMDDRALLQASLSLNPSSDLLSRIDGFNVLAPGWKKCVACPPVRNEIKITDLAPAVETGKRMPANLSGPALAYLSTGWSSPESWGTWSEGKTAELILPIKGKVRSISIEASAMVTPARPKQDVVVIINGESVFTASLHNRSDNIIQFEIPENVQEKIAALGGIHIQLQLPGAVSPMELGLGDDGRQLSLGLQSITVR